MEAALDCLHFISITRSQNPGVPPEEVVYAISLIILRVIWDVEKALQKAKKSLL